MRQRLAFLLALQCLSLNVLAQVPAVPPGAEPGQAQRQLQQLPEPSRAVVPRPTPPRLTDAAPANADDILVNVSRVNLTGPADFFTDVEFPPSDSLNGREVPLSAIYALAAEMTAYYRNAGYILTSVRVPPQTINNGVVKLEILEGHLSDVILEGGRIRPALFAQAKRRLLSERPLRSNSLERFLLLVNDLPGATAQGVLRPSPDEVGASELIVRVAQPRLNVQLSGSNRGGKYQGPNQYRAAVTLNSALGLSESTTFQYMQAQSADELQLFSLSHTARLTASGLDLTLSASRSTGAPDLDSLEEGFPLETESNQYRVELGVPLVRTRTSNLRSRLAIARHSGETEFDSVRLSADTISSARLGLTWDAADRAAGVNIVDVELAKGIGIFGSSDARSPNASRPGGDPYFWKTTLYAARLQSLTRGFSALVAVNAQYAFENLLSPEEFAFGGEQFGRAYDASELVGDSGWAGKFELRYTTRIGPELGTTFYAFAERGWVYRRLDPTETGIKRRESAISMGGGVRFSFSDWLTGYVEAAAPTHKPVAAYNEKRTRVFGGLQVGYKF